MATYRRPLYQQGDRGAEVAVLQQYLASAGFSPGSADGVFGGNTYAAVRAFQAAVGLPADGIVWDDTFAELAKRGKPGAAPATPSGTAPVMVMDPLTIEGRMPSKPLPKWVLYAGSAAAAALAYYFLVAKAQPRHSREALAGMGHCGCDGEQPAPAPALARWKLPSHLRYRPPKPQSKSRRK